MKYELQKVRELIELAGYNDYPKKEPFKDSRYNKVKDKLTQKFGTEKMRRRAGQKLGQRMRAYKPPAAKKSSTLLISDAVSKMIKEKIRRLR